MSSSRIVTEILPTFLSTASSTKDMSLPDIYVHGREYESYISGSDGLVALITSIRVSSRSITAGQA